MRWARWITLPWPGLTQLWFDGAAWGLALSCAFGWLASLALVSSFVWTELLDGGARLVIWSILAIAWVIGTRISYKQLRGAVCGTPVDEVEGLFRRAQREYLQGNWIETEQLLTRLVRTNNKDFDAHLMLASLLRRTGQWTEALHQLRKLQAMEGAEKWQCEIDRERKLIDELVRLKSVVGQTESEKPEQPESQAEADDGGPPATQAA